jgi:hypothetical protein
METTRRRIVLDKSALIAIPEVTLGTMRDSLDYVLCSHLLFEVKTDRRDPPGLLRKLLGATEDRWIPSHVDLTLWEMANGISSREWISIPGSRLSLNQIYEESERATVDTYQASIESLGRFPMACEDKRTLLAQVHPLQGEQAFYEWLTVVLQCISFSGPESVSEWRVLAFAYGGDPPCALFSPARNWFCFGVEMAGRGSILYKLWAYGDSPTSTTKPECFGFDSMYLAHMAIADGLLSCDKALLNLAWACWPEKRGSIYDYDQSSKSIRVFVPQWIA